MNAVGCITIEAISHEGVKRIRISDDGKEIAAGDIDLLGDIDFLLEHIKPGSPLTLASVEDLGEWIGRQLDKANDTYTVEHEESQDGSCALIIKKGVRAITNEEVVMSVEAGVAMVQVEAPFIEIPFHQRINQNPGKYIKPKTKGIKRKCF